MAGTCIPGCPADRMNASYTVRAGAMGAIGVAAGRRVRGTLLVAWDSPMIEETRTSLGRGHAQGSMKDLGDGYPLRPE